MVSSKANAARQYTPKQWHHLFFSDYAVRDRARGYYKCVTTGKLFGPRTPHSQLDGELAGLLSGHDQEILGEQIFRWLEKIEEPLVESIERVTAQKCLSYPDRIRISKLLMLHVSRFPDLFGRRSHINKYYGAALRDVDSFSNCAEFNASLHWSGFSLECYLKPYEFASLLTCPEDRRDMAINKIALSRRIESLCDPRILLLGEPFTLVRLIECEWELIESDGYEFVFSDRQIPPLIATGGAISFGISREFGVRLSSDSSGQSKSVVSRLAKPGEVLAINRETINRAQKWICASHPAAL